MVIPLFSSAYSFGKSILTLDEPEESIDNSKPVSIFTICKSHDIKYLYLVETSMSGFLDAEKYARQNNIQLKFGFKVVCCDNINDKSEKSFRSEHKIIIWLNESAGYENFIKLVSKAQRDGFYYIPRVDCDLLKEFWCDSLSISIPFYDSFINNNVLGFGQCVPNFPVNPTLFLENNNLPTDQILRNKVIEYGLSYNCEILETQSIFYYLIDDFKSWQVNKCIHKRTLLDKPELHGCSSNTFCLENILGEIEQENTSKFSQQFKQYELPFYGIRLPHIKIDKLVKEKLKLSDSCTHYTLLKALCKDGFYKRIKNGDIKEEDTEWYRERCTHELKVLNSLGFVDYILIVWDMINFCIENDIPIGRGRGSAAGSAVLYLLNITDIPVKRHNLLFERFLSADRAATIEKFGITYLTDAPDVDSDISKAQRYKVVEYLNSKYPNQTSKIVGITTLQGKVLLKEVAKVVDFCEQSELNRITDLIPVEFGNVADIQEVCEGIKDENGKWKKPPVDDFTKWCEKHPESYKIALKLRNLPKNKTVHASGYLITHCPIDQFIPTELTSDKQVVSSWDMYSAGTIAVKLDLLGLKTLDILDNTAKLVGKKYNQIDIDDPSIYKYLSNPVAPLLGIFQAEEGLGEHTMRKIQPENIDHIIDSITLGRPGALSSIGDYCEFKNKTKFPDINERVKDILEPTGGLLLFQEQLMALSVTMAKFTPIESNGIRKAVGKKDKKKMLSYKERFLVGSTENGFTKEYAQKTWDTFEASADYSFNKSHAASYGYNTAATVYFKTNHTREFFLSLLKYPPENGDKKETFIPNITREMALFGIKLLPPSLLKGNKDFIVEDNNIRFGLSAIKGIADAALNNLDNFKPKNCNKFEMFQAGKQAGLSCGVMASLIMSGALDEFVTENRSKLSFECLLFSKLKDKEKLYCIQNGQQYNFDLILMCRSILEWTDSLGKKVARRTRLETLRRNTREYLDIYRNNCRYEQLAIYWWETYLLGFSYSTTLKDVFGVDRPDLLNLKEFLDLYESEAGVVVVKVTESFKSTSKKGNKMAKLIIGDETVPEFKAYLCGRAYNEFFTNEATKLPEPGDIIAVRMRKTQDSGAAFIEKIQKQDVKIYTKLADLKDDKSEEDKAEPVLKKQEEFQLQN